MWHPGEWEELSHEERLRFVSWILQLIYSDAVAALEAETMGLRGEEHMSRTVALVDEQGWREINRIQDEALLAILAAKEQSGERLTESGAEGRYVMAAMLSGEMAAPPLSGEVDPDR